jgi:ABC-2 type transport system permease protein
MTTLDVRPDPGSSSPATQVLAQARLELGMMLRNGEQLLLTVVLPLGLLLGLSLSTVVDLGVADDRAARLDAVVPGMLALAVLSTAFTGLAIQTGFERRYGVLKRLGATPLSRPALLGGKALAVLAVEAGQGGLLVSTGVLLGWRPNLAGVPVAVGLVVLATAAFAALGLLLAGTLRAEATLAGANVVYLLLLGAGGIVIPLGEMPEAVQVWVELLPSAALAEGLRTALIAGGWPASDALILVSWLVLGTVATARWFRWE